MIMRETRVRSRSTIRSSREPVTCLLPEGYTPAHNMRDINLLRSLFHRAFLWV